jgi:hypothetical protein
MEYYLTKTCSDGRCWLFLGSDKILEQKPLATVMYQTYLSYFIVLDYNLLIILIYAVLNL